MRIYTADEKQSSQKRLKFTIVTETTISMDYFREQYISHLGGEWREPENENEVLLMLNEIASELGDTFICTLQDLDLFYGDTQSVDLEIV